MQPQSHQPKKSQSRERVAVDNRTPAQTELAPAAHPLLVLQRTVGNRAVERLVEESRLRAPGRVQRQLFTPLGPGGGFGGLMERDRRAAMAVPRAVVTAPVVRSGYVTYPVPVAGDQQFVLQFYRAPGAQEGATLRFKSSRDPRPPQETPIPAGAEYRPVLRLELPERLVVSLGAPGREVDVRYAAGREVRRYHAINAEQPFGPLLMNREFPVYFLQALIAHPGGNERYSFQGRLPDEAIAEPTWAPYVHPALGFSYRALRGRYQGRSVTIDYGEIAALGALREGAISTAKFLVELALYAIPYVGPLILVGQALAGRTIWGERLSTEGRVLYGIFALLPLGARLAGATGSAAEVTAARELAAARGITEGEAQTLLRGLRTLSAEERGFVEAAEAQLRTGQALTEAQARRLARLVNRIGARTDIVFSAANDIQPIWQSGRYWGMTEGAVYGTRVPADTYLQRLRAMISQKEGLVIFQGDAARLFHAHEVEGGYSAMKRLLGQEKAGFGDIVFDQATKEGNTIIVTRAHLAQHMGQSEAWATARLWGRRLTLEPLAAAGVASATYLVYMAFDWLAGE